MDIMRELDRMSVGIGIAAEEVDIILENCAGLGIAGIDRLQRLLDARARCDVALMAAEFEVRCLMLEVERWRVATGHNPELDDLVKPTPPTP